MWYENPNLTFQDHENFYLCFVTFCLGICYIVLFRCGRDFCNAQEIMEVADAMATNGMKELGYEYINLDGM